jgi:GTPase KRas protein
LVQEVLGRSALSFGAEGQKVRLTINDTAGQMEMQIIPHLVIKSGDAFVILYSCTSSLSFDEGTEFRAIIKQMAPIGGSTPLVLAGNKCDMEGERAVTVQQWSVKAQEMGAAFMECSAKSHINC